MIEVSPQEYKSPDMTNEEFAAAIQETVPFADLMREYLKTKPRAMDLLGYHLNCVVSDVYLENHDLALDFINKINTAFMLMLNVPDTEEIMAEVAAVQSGNVTIN